MLKKLLEVLFGVAFCLVIMLITFAVRGYDGEPPVITVREHNVTYTEGQPYSVLLGGVSAYDEKDGDVTSSLLVERVLPISQTEVLVTYVARDSANNVVKRDVLVSYVSDAE